MFSVQGISKCVLMFTLLRSVAPQGFKCPDSNYRLFAVHSTVSELWRGNSDDAVNMCKKSGHVLVKNLNCLQKLYREASSSVFGGTAPKNVWIDQTNKAGCVSWSSDLNNITSTSCAEKFVAICQGMSSEDHTQSDAYKGSPASKSGVVPAIDAYYVLCGILGVILISIVVSAAIWRSGYINNRYSFRRMPAANAAAAGAKKPAPKSQTVTSNLESEVPHGYVKASVTKETIA